MRKKWHGTKTEKMYGSESGLERKKNGSREDTREVTAVRKKGVLPLPFTFWLVTSTGDCDQGLILAP